MKPNLEWFREARYGLFMHYGVYSLLERGEWVRNREAIPAAKYRALRDTFTAARFDADGIIRRAKAWGMKYAVLTTKHHDGFCLYDSKFTDFTAPRSAAKRDLVAEFVSACRKYGLRIGLYHSLNDWNTSPDAVDALERPETCHQEFIDFVHGQIREIMTNYGPVDVMWYDGWWPFDAKGWQAEKLNAMVRELQPGILVNGRSGLPGDFKTPEQHVTPSSEPWEAAITLNNSWGYHRGDNNWKSPKQVAEMLRICSAGQGNLLLNVGPKPDGSFPEEAVGCLDRVGEWLRKNEEAIRGTERFVVHLRERGDGRSEFNHSGAFTASHDAFYWHIHSWPGSRAVLAGVQCTVASVSELGSGVSFPFQQVGERVIVETPETRDTAMPVVLRFSTREEPMMYLTGGAREPKAPHVHYDPVESDMLE